MADLTPVVFLLSGALFVVSAANSEGTDLRPGRYTDLASLVQTESDSTTSSPARSAELDAEVDQPRPPASSDANVGRFQRQIESPEGPRRPDPARRARADGHPLGRARGDHQLLDADLNLLVVHQQDIQAVVNAMWQGGAPR